MIDNINSNEYMTVGQIAKKLGISVRTLQYYDKQGFFSPSLQSEGGRRLYSNKDLVDLHQILSLKKLGFSLSDIKSKIMPLDKPSGVVDLLNNQANAIKDKIKSLTESYEEIEILKQEVFQMNTVDFKKYADIIVNIRMKNDNYWMIKHFDDKTLDQLRGHFNNVESGHDFMEKYRIINDEILKLYNRNIPHNDKQAQKLVKEFWQMILELTKGDMTMIANFMKIKDESEFDSKNESDQVHILNYIEKALEVYFDQQGVDPFKGEII